LQDYKVPIDIGDIFKTTDLLFYSGNTPAHIFVRLYENRYDIDMGRFSSMRLALTGSDDSVYMISSSTIEIINGVKYIKLIFPNNLLTARMDYSVRPTVTIDGNNIRLKKYKIFVRTEITSDLNTAISITKQINDIYERYLSSVKRDEIGVPHGLIPLDNDARININYMQNDIVEHIGLEYQGHGTRLNKDRELEYYDTEDEVWYRLNSLHGGFFDIPRKPSNYSYYGGDF